MLGDCYALGPYCIGAGVLHSIIGLYLCSEEMPSFRCLALVSGHGIFCTLCDKGIMVLIWHVLSYNIMMSKLNA